MKSARAEAIAEATVGEVVSAATRAGEGAGPQNQELFFAPLLPPPPSPPPPVVGGPIGVDFRIANIEITQAVQCLDQTQGDIMRFCAFDNQIPLVAGKPTAIRVYVESAIPTGSIPTAFLRPNVRVQLTIVKPDRSIISLQVGTLSGLVKEVPDRNLINDTANFIFLCDTCSEGDLLRVRATVEPLSGSLDTNPDDNEFGDVELPVFERRPLEILYRPVKLRGGVVPASGDIAMQHTYLLDVYPLPGVSYRGGPDFVLDVAPEAFVDGDDDTIVELLNKGAMFGPLCPFAPCPGPDQIVAWVPRKVWGNGISDPIWCKGCAGAHMGVVTVIDSMYTYGVLGSPTLAHEIAHNLGRRHPCTGGFGDATGFPDDPSWPYLGMLDMTSFAIFNAFETGIRQLPVVASVLTAPSGRLFDFMIGHHCRTFPGYECPPMPPSLPICPPIDTAAERAVLDVFIDGVRPNAGPDVDFRLNGSWVSPYTYHQLFCTQSPDSSESRESKEGRASPGGACNKKAGTPILLPPPVLIVSGILDPDGTGVITSIYRRTEPGPLPEHEPGPFCLRLEEDGQTMPIVVSQQCFDISFIRESDTVPRAAIPRPALFTVALPWVDGATRVVLERNGQPLDMITVSASAPQAQFVPPSARTPLIQWQASDADGDPLAFMLLYSPDGDKPAAERRLIPLAVDIPDGSLQVRFDQLPGSEHAFFRLVATDNTGQTTVIDSPPLSVPRKPPRVAIIAPQTGAKFAQGGAVVLRGDVDDLEDVRLPAEAFAWSSNHDGFIGFGQTLGTATLTPGRHVITLTVVDSDGLVGQASVALRVCSDTSECVPGLLCPCESGAAPVPLFSPFGLLIGVVILLGVGALTLSRGRASR